MAAVRCGTMMAALKPGRPDRARPRPASPDGKQFAIQFLTVLQPPVAPPPVPSATAVDHQRCASKQSTPSHLPRPGLLAYHCGRQPWSNCAAPACHRSTSSVHPVRDRRLLCSIAAPLPSTLCSPDSTWESNLPLPSSTVNRHSQLPPPRRVARGCAPARS